MVGPSSSDACFRRSGYCRERQRSGNKQAESNGLAAQRKTPERLRCADVPRRNGNNPKVVSRISPVDLLACPGTLEVSCRAQDCVWGGSGPELSRNLGHAGWLLPDVVPRRMVCHAFKANVSLHFQDMTCKFLCLSRPYVPVKITCPRSLFLIS